MPANMDIDAAAQQAAMQGNMSSQAAREASVMLSANTGPYQKEMGQAAKATEHLATTLEKLDKALKKTFQHMGRSMVGVGGAMQAMAAGATASAAQFEESFARVAKTTGLENRLKGIKGPIADMSAAFGVGDNELQRFENDIRSLSTAIPVGTGELSHLADVAGQLGVEAENLTHFADTAAKLGAGISDLSSDVAIAGLANLSGALGVAEENVHHLGSSLAELANHTRGNANEMLQFSDRLAGTAVQVGMTADEVLALGAAVSAIGAEPQLGASAIVQVITQISRALQQGGDEAERFAQVMDMSLGQLQELWSSGGATPVLMRLLETLSTQGDEASTTLQKLKLGGIGVTQVLGGLAAQMDVVTDAMGKSSAAFEEGTAVGELAAVRFDTLNQKMKQFRQSTSEVFRSMGQGTLVAIKPLVDMMTRVVNIFNELPQPMKTAMGLFAGIGGAAMTALGAFTLFFAAFHAFFLVATNLPHVLALIGTAIDAMAGKATVAGARFLALAKIMDGLKAGVAGMIASFKAMGAAMSTAFQASGAAFKSLLGLNVALGKTQAGLKGVAKWTGGQLWHDWSRALGMTAKAVGALGAAVGKMAFAVGKALAPYAALMAVIIGGSKIWSAMKKDVDDVTVSLVEAADAMGLVLDSFEDIQEMEVFEKGSLSLATEAEDLLDILDRLDEEDKKQHLISFGFQLLRSGNSPDQVQTQIERLAALANVPIEFKFTLQDITTGDDFAMALENAESMYRRVREGIERRGAENTFGYGGIAGFTPETTIDFQEEFKRELNDLAAAAQNDAAAMSSFLQVANDVDKAFRSGQISLREYNDTLDMLEEKIGVLPSASEELEEAFRLRQESQPTQRVLRERGVPILNEQSLSSARSALIRLMEANPTDRLSRDMQRSVLSVIGTTDDLIESVDELNQSELDQIMAEFRGLAIEANVSDVMENLDDQLTDLGKRMEMPTEMRMDEEEAKRYWDSLVDSFPQEVGLRRALIQAQTEMDALIEKGEQWTEEGDRYRKMIQQWGKEFSEIQVNSLVSQLQAAPAADQIRILVSEMEKLHDLPENIRINIQTTVEQQTLQREEQAFRGVMDQYDNLLKRREDIEESHSDRLQDLVEDRNDRITDLHEDHQERLEDLQENHQDRLEDLRENHHDRMKDIAEQEKEALEDRVETTADAFKASENLEADHAQSAARLAANMARQNRAMSEARKGLGQLQQLGMTDETIEALGLNDPRKVNQIQRLVQDAMANPRLIDQINQEWSQRLDLAQGFVDTEGTTEITERFDEMREDAKKAYKDAREDAREALADAREDAQENLRKSIEGVHEQYADSVADAKESYADQISDIEESLNDLGRETAKTIEELIDTAMESGISGLRDWAVEVDRLKRFVQFGTLAPEEFRRGRNAEIDMGMEDEAKKSGFETMKGWWDGFQDKSRSVWDNLKREMEEGGGLGMTTIQAVFGTGVTDSMRILKGLTEQDPIWDPAIREAFQGAGGMRDAVTGELEKGKDQITTIMGGWASTIEDSLNPVLDAVGADPIEIRTTTRSSSGGTYSGSLSGGRQEFAQGGVLPDDARIQPPGTLVQWAEPETGGEAFIPLASSKRRRSQEIWRKTGELLGINIDRLDPHSLHSFADGGFSVPDMSDMGAIGHATEKAMEYVLKQVMGSQDVSLGQVAGPSQAIDGGWRQMWSVLSQAFPGATLHSGFRPGAITATGNPSYHGMGRAIDVTPSTDIAEWIRDNFMARTKEMIYSPMNSRQIHNGKNHYYGTPITRAQHWDHVHWAMAGGGQLTDKMKKGNDSIPAWVADGEFVMQAKAVKEYGLEAMEALNAREFAQGGIVGNAPRSRGREPLGPSQADLVGALTKALEKSGAREVNETNFGPIEVKAQDAKDLISQLDQRRRRSRLTAAGRERG